MFNEITLNDKGEAEIYFDSANRAGQNRVFGTIFTNDTQIVVLGTIRERGLFLTICELLRRAAAQSDDQRRGAGDLLAAEPGIAARRSICSRNWMVSFINV